MCAMKIYYKNKLKIPMEIVFIKTIVFMYYLEKKQMVLKMQMGTENNQTVFFLAICCYLYFYFQYDVSNNPVAITLWTSNGQQEMCTTGVARSCYLTVI